MRTDEINKRHVAECPITVRKRSEKIKYAKVWKQSVQFLQKTNFPKSSSHLSSSSIRKIKSDYEKSHRKIDKTVRITAGF